MRYSSSITLCVGLLLTACVPASPGTGNAHQGWVTEAFSFYGVSLQHPPAWTVTTENHARVLHHPTDPDTHISIYGGREWKTEVAERKLGDEFLSMEDHAIEGGYVTVLTFRNEGPSRYRQYLFRMTRNEKESVIVADLIATVPNNAEGIPDFSQTTEAEEILSTVHLIK